MLYNSVQQMVLNKVPMSCLVFYLIDEGVVGRKHSVYCELLDDQVN